MAWAIFNEAHQRAILEIVQSGSDRIATIGPVKHGPGRNPEHLGYLTGQQKMAGHNADIPDPHALGSIVLPQLQCGAVIWRRSNRDC